MNAVKRIKVPNRLKKIIRTSGGKTFDEGIASAESNLTFLKDKSYSVIQQIVENIRNITEQPPANDPEILQLRLSELYDLADEFVGIADIAGVSESGKAALSFCELLDYLSVTGNWNAPAINVHVEGIRLLFLKTGESQEEKEKILSGLKSVVKHISAESVPPKSAG